MKLEEAIALLQGRTRREIHEYMRARLTPAEAESFSVLVDNVSHDVLVLVSARALTRLAAGWRVRRSGPPPCDAAGPVDPAADAAVPFADPQRRRTVE